METLVDRALELEPHERSALVRESCADDPWLEQQVFALLAGCDPSDDFLGKPVFEHASDALQSLAEELTDEDSSGAVAGTRLGHFDIIAKLGEGGMGEVYRARDTKLGRDVALKALRRSLVEEPERLERFRREARVLAALDHPAIVTVFSVEESDGLHFLTMQLVEGKTLDDVIEPGGLELDRFFEIAIPLIEAVAVAHERGIVHRDLKPSNAMWSNDGRLKVLDFGLAKLAAPDVEDGSSEGPIAGSPRYMSPEQARGDSVDHRTDVFSLGVMLFEMSTGERPFGGDTSVELLSAVVNDPAPELNEVKPGLSRHLGRVIGRCLEKAPEDRYQTARALYDVLKELRTRSIAVLPFETLGSGEPTAFADGVHGDVLTRLSKLPGLSVTSRTSVMRYREPVESPLPKIAQELGVTWIVQGEVQEAAGQVQVNARLVHATSDSQVWAESYRRQLTAEELFEIQGDLTDAIATQLETQLAPQASHPAAQIPTRDLEAYRLATMGRAQLDRRTANGCRRAIEIFGEATQRDPNYASAWVGLADALVETYWYGYEDSEDLLVRAKESVDRALELDPGSAAVRVSLATYHGAMRNGPAAMVELERAIRIQPGYAEAHNKSAYLCNLYGRAAEALESARRSVELNPLSAEAVINLAISLLTNGRPEQALGEAERAAEISPGWDTADFVMGLTLYHCGRFEPAMEALSDLHVEWTGQGAEACLALSHLALDDRTSSERVLGSMDPEVDGFSAGLVRLALGETDRVLEDLSRVREPGDWPSLAVHHLFPHLWDSVREDPRYVDLVRRTYESHQLERPRGSP